MRKSDRSSIGAAERASTHTKAGSMIAAAIRPTITMGAVQPSRPASDNPTTRPVSPPSASRFPGMS